MCTLFSGHFSLFTAQNNGSNRLTQSVTEPVIWSVKLTSLNYRTTLTDKIGQLVLNYL